MPYSREQLMEFMKKLYEMYGFEVVHAAQLSTLARSGHVSNAGTLALAEVIINFIEYEKLDTEKVFECQQKIADLTARLRG